MKLYSMYVHMKDSNTTFVVAKNELQNWVINAITRICAELKNKAKRTFESNLAIFSVVCCNVLFLTHHRMFLYLFTRRLALSLSFSHEVVGFTFFRETLIILQSDYYTEPNSHIYIYI